MNFRHSWTGDAWVGGVYFLLAAIAIATTRFDGGLAFLWVASAFLITVLLRRPRSEWKRPVAWSAAGSIVATGMFGLGWTMAPLLAVANMAEAIVAAWFLRRAHSSLLPLGSLRWTAHLFWCAGIVGPAAMALIALWPMWLYAGGSPAETFIRVVLGHGLGNMTFIPIMTLFATANSGPWRRQDVPRSDAILPMLFALHLVVTLAVFSQHQFPLLFLPILPIIGIVFRGSSRWTAAALLSLVIIASGATILGIGPIQLSPTTEGLRAQMTQFYLVSTVLTIVPVAAQLRHSQWLGRRVRDSEARYRMLADHSGDIIMHTDKSGEVQFVSPSIERVGGYRSADLIGRNCMIIVHPDYRDLVLNHHRFAAGGEGRDTRFEYRARRSDGGWGWFESDCRGIIDPNGERGVISMIRDIGNRKEREDKLARAALTDYLTGLPNRQAFRLEVERALAGSDPAPATVALLDIDHFKSVNDRFGHDVGDEVLQSFAMTAQHHLREKDMIARFGGEEFAILLPGTDEAGAIRLCERLRSAVAESICLTAAGAVRFTISGGVAALGTDGFDAALKRADEALYKAKHQGRDRMIRAAA